MGRKREGHRLEIRNPDCAGIDIGKTKHYVAINPERSETPVRMFETFTDSLEAMGQWLLSNRVTLVTMEATGVYWIPAYEVLERMGLTVQLVNPRATKQISGRKSDVLDCQWLWQLTSYGLLPGAFRPADAVCELRSYVRQRARLTQDAGRAVQHIHKALTQMNVLLDAVISDVMGVTGQRILRAIVAGERDGRVLAGLRDMRTRADEELIARSLKGNWREEHLFELQQALERWDHLQGQIAQCEQKIMVALERMAPEPAAVEADGGALQSNPKVRTARERVLQRAIRELMGVDLTAIPTIGIETALVIASEIGPDLSRFADAQHFCSWLNLTPGTRISGGRQLGGAAPRRMNRVGQALRMCASTARRSDSFIGASHRARLARLDAARAVKATAHQLARMIYALLTRGEAYVERGIETFEEARRDRQLRALQRNARRLGFELQHAPEKSAA